ncbi:MAG: hypothetical protein KKD69_01080 [Euryarchaeota archaeon]|nr:hypothetical protein [Euryarchaeota archaeon]MBU4491041.1 hypothetical protein [Euryarchaeota archaeon]
MKPLNRLFLLSKGKTKGHPLSLSNAVDITSGGDDPEEIGFKLGHEILREIGQLNLMHLSGIEMIGKPKGAVPKTGDTIPLTERKKKRHK